MKKRILSIFLAVNILTSSFILTSCSKKEEQEISTNQIVEEQDNNRLEQEFIDELKRKIDSIDVEYLYSEYYPNEETINEYKLLASSNIECPETDDSYKNIYQYIKRNTQVKYEDNNIFYDKNESLEKQEIDENFYYAINDALDHIFSNHRNNYKEDICSLKSISIVNKDLSDITSNNDSPLGYFDSETRTVYIDYNKAFDTLELINVGRKVTDQEERTIRDFLGSIVEHEFDHVRQFSCEHRITNNEIVKTVDFNNTPSFLIEASAESAVYNYNNYNVKHESNEYTYETFRESEALLMLLAAFKEKRTIENYYTPIFDSNAKEFWEYFGINSDQELNDFYNIYYAINTINERTGLSRKLKEEDQITTSNDIKKSIGNEYLIDMSKIIFIDLIDATERENLNLDDNLLLYIIVKSYLTYESMKMDYEECKYVFDDEFVHKFNEIDKNYKEYLYKKYNLTEEELNEKLNDQNLETELYKITKFSREDYDYLDSRDISRFNSLDRKFPLLKPILFSKVCISSFKDIDEYIESSEESKVKTK